MSAKVILIAASKGWPWKDDRRRSTSRARRQPRSDGQAR